MKDKNDDLIFEISDDAYLHNVLFLISLGVIMFFILYFQTSEKSFIDNIAGVLVIYIFVKSIRKFYQFFMKKEIKILFYKNKILKVNLSRELKIDKINEIYKFSTIILPSGAGYKKIKRVSILQKIATILLLWLFIPLSLLQNILLSIYYKKIAIQKLLILIGNNDDEVIIIPIPYHDKEKYKKLNDYFKTYLNTDINNLQTNYFVPQKG